MNLRRTWTALLACGAVALLALPPGASAKPGYFVFQGHRSVEMSLRGSHGYRINIVKQGRRYVYLLAGKEQSGVSYLTRSLEPKGSEIKARFPGVGRISVRFRPQGPTHEDKLPPFPGCKGGEIVKQPGHFVGTIRFRGERGYTSAQATRAPGETIVTEKEVCKRSMFDDGPDPEVDRTELLAYSRSRERTVGFSASIWGPPDPLSTTFTASVVERRRGMRISRFIFGSGKESQLVAGDSRPHPLSATVTPPSPFSGSADFQRTAEGDRTWTGSLSVAFPGLGPVALAGPGFVARFCQHSGCHGHTIDGLRLPLALSTPSG